MFIMTTQINAIKKGFEDHDEYKNWLADVFDRYGWESETEVSSDDGSAICDIIVEHDFWGMVGIECKYKDEIEGRTVADALTQVQRYSYCRYNRKKVDNWAIAISERPGVSKYQYNVSSSLVNGMNCGVLRTVRKLELKFNNSNPMVNIPIANVSYEDGSLEEVKPRRLEECKTQDALDYLESNHPLEHLELKEYQKRLNGFGDSESDSELEKKK